MFPGPAAFLGNFVNWLRADCPPGLFSIHPKMLRPKIHPHYTSECSCCKLALSARAITGTAEGKGYLDYVG